MGRCQAGPSVSRTPHISLSPSRAETVTHPTQCRVHHRSKPIPFLCSSPRRPPVKFRPCPAPRCSIQASVSCLSHPFACRLACGPLASHIVVEASRHPAAPADCCHRRYTTVMPVPSTRRQRLTQRLYFLLPCWHSVRLCLASSSLALCCVGTVSWHTHACHVATTSPPVQLTSSSLAYRQKCLRRRLHASSCRLLPCHALRQRVLARTVRARPCATRRS
jgi:hypothetical protein